MKIIIYQNREVYKEESKIGNDSENKVETLEFEFPEEYADFTKYIEFQIKGEKYVDLIEDNKYVITREVAKYGKIKTQVVLKKNTEKDVMIFKSDVFTLTVSNSINATENLIYTVGVDLIEKIVTKNNEQDFRLNNLELDNTTNKEKILDLEAKNTEDIAEINEKNIAQDKLIEQLQVENTKLKKEINSMQIPGEATGNPIHLTDSSDMECEIVPIGGAEQETREGYNKIKYPYVFVDSANTTIQDDSANNLIVENTTPGSNSYFFIDNINLEADKTYTISRIYEIMTGTKTDETAQIELYLAGTWKKVLLYQSSSLATFTVDTSGKYRIVIKNGNSSSALKVKYTNLMILEGTYTADTLPPYEQYGASPSPDYPSPIQAVGQNGSVEIEVCNKNLAKINETNWELTENNTIKNKARNEGTKLATFKLKKGQTVNINLVLLSRPSVSTTFSMYKNGKEYVNGAFNNFQGFSLNTIYTRTITATEDIQITSKLWGNANSDIFEFQFWAEIDETTDYIPHESYTKTLPIQKEFVKIGDVEDTFVKVDGKWYEKHDIPKYELTGNESFSRGTTRNGFYYFEATISDLAGNYGKINRILCNVAKEISASDMYEVTSQKDLIGTNSKNIRLMLSDINTVSELQAYLSEQYANETPATLYYLSTTPKLIECTEEQSEILNSFCTYKGVTNVSMSGIGKIKIIYKQDQETINKNYENRLAALEEYSTEEQVVGKWIDGKTLYKKTIIATSPTVETDGTAANVYIDISSLNAKFIGVLNAYSILDTGDIIGLPYTNNSGRVFRTYANTITQKLLIGTNSTSFSRRTCYITLIYTKTTD